MLSLRLLLIFNLIQLILLVVGHSATTIEGCDDGPEKHIRSRGLDALIFDSKLNVYRDHPIFDRMMANSKSKYKNRRKTNGKTTLKTVVLIHRHGDRNPITIGPKDHNKDWPDGLGQLTNAGKQRMYAIGNFVRRRYKQFLSDNPLEVYVRSADSDRCIASAQLVASGMYTPVGRYVWNPNLIWQPMPVHTVPAQTDSLLETNEACPRIQSEMKAMQSSDRVKKLLARMVTIINEAERDLGLKIESFEQISWIYNDLKIEWEQKRIVPSWYDDNVRTMLHAGAAEVFDIYTGTDLLKKLFSGPLMADIAYRFSNNNVVSEDGVKIQKKLFQYSTHDTEIAATLNTLSLWDHKMPVFGSSIFFELHAINGKSQVKLFYLSDGNSTINELELPCGQDKGQPCLLADFQKMVQKLQLPDWNGTCFEAHDSAEKRTANKADEPIEY